MYKNEQKDQIFYLKNWFFLVSKKYEFLLIFLYIS